ncbi:hypothetical protein DBY65_004545 [Pseudomonas sp. RIT412]|nr:hypothetical protein DBP26_006115 [Pseudomonas sp. RIT 409]RAU55202.1 hypothetical protein DBY65_004545 [Pseudomonas sp. RIT 412]
MPEQGGALWVVLRGSNQAVQITSQVKVALTSYNDEKKFLLNEKLYVSLMNVTCAYSLKLLGCS